MTLERAYCPLWPYRHDVKAIPSIAPANGGWDPPDCGVRHRSLLQLGPQHQNREGVNDGEGAGRSLFD
jgi:hypothetical protein